MKAVIVGGVAGGATAAARIRSHGIRLAHGYRVEAFQERSGGVEVILQGAVFRYADMVILAIGIPPRVGSQRMQGLRA